MYRSDASIMKKAVGSIADRLLVYLGYPYSNTTIE